MKIETLKKKLGVSQRKHVALLLGVNKLTLQRWRKKHGDEITDKYLPQAKKLLKMSPAKIDEELEKATKRKPDQRFNTRKDRKAPIKKKTKKITFEKVIQETAHELHVEDLILDLYIALKKGNPQNGLASVRDTIGRYVKEKLKMEEV